MKIRFNDATEVTVKSITKHHVFGEGSEDYDHVSIETFDEQSQAVFETKDMSTFTIIRTGFDNVTISGYTMESISADFDDQENRFRIELKK